MRHINERKLRVLLLASGVLLTSGLLASISFGAPAYTPNTVVLNYFEVVWDSDLEVVCISWETATEFETSGFRVERATSPTGTFTQIGEFVPAVGDQIAGATYGPFFDTDVITGTAYWYQLVVYAGNGQPDYSLPRVTVVAGNLLVFLPVVLNSE